MLAALLISAPLLLLRADRVTGETRSIRLNNNNSTPVVVVVVVVVPMCSVSYSLYVFRVCNGDGHAFED